MLSLIHLSDIHFRADIDANPLLRRVPEVANAIAAICRQSAGSIIVVTGDIAFSGKQVEYDFARTFFEGVASILHEDHSLPMPQLVFVPGNHDCDFHAATKVQDILKKEVLANGEVDQDIYASITSVQQTYRAFVAKTHETYGHAKPTPIALGLEQTAVRVAGMDLLFVGYNSSWNSSMKELQGSLLVPTATLEALEDTPNDAPSLVVACFHHPYAWYASENGRRFRRALESRVDVVMTGHEHDVAVYTTTASGSSSTLGYVEGALLQTDEDIGSEFVVVQLDDETQKYRPIRYEWNGDRYGCDDSAVWSDFRRNTERLRGGLTFTTEHRNHLSDPGAHIVHPASPDLRLQDFFVFPDLRLLDYSPQTGSGRQSMHPIQFVSRHAFTLIVGPETSGKSSLAKMLCQQLHASGVAPLIESGEHFRATSRAKIIKAVKGLVRRQYGEDSVDSFLELPKERVALIIDDLHLQRLSVARRASMINILKGMFGTIICFSPLDVRLEDYTAESGEDDPMWDFVQAEVLFLGNQKRGEMVQKWFSLEASDPTRNDESSFREMVRAEETIRSLIGRNMLLPYPIFVLAVLQQLRSTKQIQTGAGSRGYLYESLIVHALGHRVSSSQLDSLLNWCAQLANYMWNEARRVVSVDEVKAFHEQYCREFLVDIDVQSTLKQLGDANILRFDDSSAKFSYPYCFQYFASKGLVSKLERPDLIDVVNKLFKNVHSEESANVLMFLSYLSRDMDIVDAMTRCAAALFPEEPELDVVADGEFLGEVLAVLPDLRLDDRTPMERRKETLALRDQHDESELSVEPDDEDADTDPDSEYQDVVIRDIMAAQRTIQVLGQVLRNYSGVMSGARKIQLAQSCYSLSFRVLHFVIALLRDSREDVVADIARSIARENPDIGEDVAVYQARSIVFSLSVGVTAGMVRHLSTSIGVKELRPVFRELAKSGGPTYEVADVSIKLEHSDGIPEVEALDLYRLEGGGILLRGVVRHLMWHHMYTMPVKYRKKQSICEAMDIKMSPVLLSSHPLKKR